MLQRLLLDFVVKVLDNGTAGALEHIVLILVAIACHGANHSLKHEDVLNLGNLGDKNLLLAQVFHLFLIATVAIDDAPAVEVMKSLEPIERAHAFNHLVATAQRLDGILGKHEGIEP